MASLVHVLCYHRVVADDECRENLPYFLRGTAVAHAVFRQQIRDVHEHFECLDERRALDVLSGAEELERPGCWITFDDAYAEVIHAAAPILDDAGMRASVFVSTAVLGGGALPADRWYATLNTATRRRGTLVGPQPWQYDLDDPNSLRRFVDGPEKRRFLRSSQSDQEETLRRLAAELDADSTVPGPQFYLDAADIRDLSRRGWSIGSHTVSHPILVDLAGEAQRRELDGSWACIKEILGCAPRTLAYPDGAWDEATANRVRESGYDAAVTLVPRVARAGGSMFAIPRILARNNPEFVRTLSSLGSGS